MRFLLAFSDIILDLQRGIKELDHLAFISIIAALSILLMAVFRYIIKYSFNVNTIKRNITTHIVFSILIFAVIAGLLLLYF